MCWIFVIIERLMIVTEHYRCVLIVIKCYDICVSLMNANELMLWGKPWRWVVICFSLTSCDFRCRYWLMTVPKSLFDFLEIRMTSFGSVQKPQSTAQSSYPAWTNVSCFRDIRPTVCSNTPQVIRPSLVKIFDASVPKFGWYLVAHPTARK